MDEEQNRRKELLKKLSDVGFRTRRLNYVYVLGQTGPMETALLARLVRSGDGASVTELASSVCSSAQSVSRLVKTMEAKGLVVKQPHPSDRRNTLVRITQKGREFHGDATRRAAEYFDRVAEKMTLDEMKLFLELSVKWHNACAEVLYEYRQKGLLSETDA